MGEQIVQIPVPESMALAMSATIAERMRQNKIWANHHTLDDKTWLMILIEEVGEVAMAMQGEGDTEEELTHVAAVAVAWLEHLKRRTQ